MIVKSSSARSSQDEAGHWYSPDGKPCHTVPYADKKRAGEQRSTTLKDARKMGLLPSVTQILRILNKHALNDWRCEMAVIAALTLPRGADEPVDAYAARVVNDADTVRNTAADFGTTFHNYIKNFLTGRDFEIETAHRESWGLFLSWIEANIAHTIAAEDVVVNKLFGYAGQRDLKALLIGIDGPCVVDFKTQRFRDGKANFYDEWCLQLGAYELADPGSTLVSVAIPSDRPDRPQMKIWTENEKARAKKAFVLCAKLWQTLKQYEPATT